MTLFHKILLGALLAAQHLLASAGGVPSTFDGKSSPPAATSNSSTITFEWPFPIYYDPTAPGGIGLFIDKRTFQIDAPANYALTGKMSATLTAQYDLGAGVGNAYMDLTFDVLSPHCPIFCGPFDSDLVGTSRNGTLTHDAGDMQYVADASNASGLYSRLLVYEIIVGMLPAYSGHIQFQSIIFTAETVAIDSPSSPVPELPAVALYGLGLAALGIAVRAKSGKRRIVG
jgi:hypothetical protein